MENSRGVIDEITAKTSREPPLIFKDWASASKSQQAAIQVSLSIHFHLFFHDSDDFRIESTWYHQQQVSSSDCRRME